MKWIRRILRVLIVLFFLLLAGVPFFVRKLDDRHYSKTAFYQKMTTQLQEYNSLNPYIDSGIVMAGWAKVNITPLFPVPSAGYGSRKGTLIRDVHDSLFVRAIVFRQNNITSALVSCDLLIIPPSVTALLKTSLFSVNIPYENIYLGATHTHNSMGGWGQKYIGELFAGKYSEATVDLITTGITNAIQKAMINLQPVETGFLKIPAGDLVTNRLVGNKGTEDPWLRLLQFRKTDGTKAVLASFSAHATTLSDTVMQFSRDYPGELVDKLERENNIQQAVYMAGAVGSMGPEEPAGTDWEQLSHLAGELENKADDSLANGPLRTVGYLRQLSVPLQLREPQWRFSQNWCFRHWLWTKLYGDYPADVKALRINNTVMVGLPCDFSGELVETLEQYANAKGKNLIITSFNGGYAGYITNDGYYGMDTYETRTMNWFGPGNGAYFSEIVKRIIDII